MRRNVWKIILTLLIAGASISTGYAKDGVPIMKIQINATGDVFVVTSKKIVPITNLEELKKKVDTRASKNGGLSVMPILLMVDPQYGVPKATVLQNQLRQMGCEHVGIELGTKVKKAKKYKS